MIEQVLTTKEAAAIITVSTGTLYNWRCAGIISKDKRYRLDYVLDIRERWIKGELI